MAAPIPDPNPTNGFLNSFAYMADGLAAFLSHGFQVDDFVNFSDNAAAVAVDAPQAPQEVMTATGEVVSSVGDAIGNAAKDAANSTLTAAAPYLLAAGVVFLALEMRRAR